MFLYLLLSVLSAYNGIQVTFDLSGRDEPLDPEACKSELRRNLFGIIWSCLSTIIICAWTSVHPNVPPPNTWKARWSRLQLMFWMIIAPELVLAWAVRQLFAARDIRDTYNNSRQGLPEWSKWTLAHGHLLGMGGFTLVDPDLKKLNPKYQNGQVLTYDQFKQLLKDPRFEVPDISTAEIQDRSKGDALWKLIAILQTSWFIMQCIARGRQHLALSELELVTLALASLNAMTFAFWWYKPLGVQEPLKIYWKTEEQNTSDLQGSQDDLIILEVEDFSGGFHHLSLADVVSKAWAFVKGLAIDVTYFVQNPCEEGPAQALVFLFISLPMRFTWRLAFPFFLVFPLGIILLFRFIKTEPVRPGKSQGRGLLAVRIITSLQMLRYRLSSAVAKFVGKWLEEIFDMDGNILPFLFGWFFLLPALFVLLLLFAISFIPFLILLFLISFIFTAVFGIVTTSTVRPGSSHVPSFYAPSTQSDCWSRMVVFALFGFIFGSLHCIGWYFKYPTRFEQTLWQATSLAITIIPLIVAPIDFLLTARLRNRDVMSLAIVERTALLLLDFITTILLFIYVPARLSLIAQAFALLRSQPSSALVAVDWTKYVPHLFS